MFYGVRNTVMGFSGEVFSSVYYNSLECCFVGPVVCELASGTQNSVLFTPDSTWL